MATTTTNTTNNTTPASSVTEDEEDNDLPEVKSSSKESAASEAKAVSDSLAGKYINSTYLIDQSKKALLGYCFFPTGNTVPNSLRGMNVSLAGNISPKVLSKITVGFKENFEDGADVVKKDFDKLMKPVNTLLSGLVARIPVLNKLNLNIGGNSGLRETGIMAYALFGGLMDMAGFDAIGDGNLSQFDLIYCYNVPIRKAPPALSMGLGSDFEIEFRYGSCNVFDAYWEVYYPLMRLKNTLFPSLSTSGTGLGTMTGVRAPYPQEAFIALLKNVFTLGSNPTGILGATKELGKIQAMFDANDSIEEKAQKQIDKWRSKGGTIKNKKGKKVQEKLDKLFNGKYASFKGITGASEILADYRPEEDDEDVEIKVGDILGEILDKYYEDTTNNEDISKFKINSITTKNPQFLEKKKEDTSKSKDNYGSIIKSIINFEPTMVGQTLANLYTNYVSGSCRQIYFAFPSKYVTSLVDLYEINTTTGASGIAYLSLQNIIFEDVDVSFDFSNVDERGYPMAGSLHIKAMWPVTGPSSALSFRNPGRTTDNMKENISEF